MVEPEQRRSSSTSTGWDGAERRQHQQLILVIGTEWESYHNELWLKKRCIHEKESCEFLDSDNEIRLGFCFVIYFKVCIEILWERIKHILIFITTNENLNYLFYNLFFESNSSNKYSSCILKIKWKHTLQDTLSIYEVPWQE